MIVIIITIILNIYTHRSAVVGLLRTSSRNLKGIIKEARASSQGLVRASQQSAQRTSLDYCKNLEGILEHIN